MALERKKAEFRSWRWKWTARISAAWAAFLVRPRVNDANWLSFTDTEANIASGYAAATQALARFESYWERPGSVFPRRWVHVEVDVAKCIGCGICEHECPVKDEPAVYVTAVGETRDKDRSLLLSLVIDENARELVSRV